MAHHRNRVSSPDTDCRSTTLTGPSPDLQLYGGFDRQALMLKKTKRLLLWIPITVFLAVCGATVWSLLTSYRFRTETESHLSNKLASVKGWKTQRLNGNTKVYEASVESFAIERGKLGPFSIGPLHVARLDKVVIDFYLEGLSSVPEFAKKLPDIPVAAPAKNVRKTPAPPARQNGSAATAPEHRQEPAKTESFSLDSLEGPLADIHNSLFYRRSTIRVLSINGLCVNLWAGEKRLFRISSDHAEMDRQTRDIVFTGHASLDAAENGRVISHRITWVRKTSLFRIKDPFVLTKAAEKREGRELETDYQMKRIRYQIKG